MTWPGACGVGYLGFVVNGRTMRALVPRWALRWCAPALLLLVVLVAQPATCPVGDHQLDGAPSVVASPVVGASAVGASAVEASVVASDFRHGPICHGSSAGDLLWTRSHPARTSVVKTASESTAAVTSASRTPAAGPDAGSPGAAPAPSGRAILLAIGIARS